MSNRSRSIFVALLLSCCAGPVACSSSETDAGASGVGGRLEKDTGVPWVVQADPRSGDVRFLAPGKPVPVGSGSPEAVARAFFERYRTELGVSGAEELRVVPADVAEGADTYVRFEHWVSGVKVFDVVSSARFTPDGALVWAQPGFRADLATVATTPSLKEEDAVAKAADHVNRTCGASPDEPPMATLGIDASEGAAPRLVWRVAIPVQTATCTDPIVTIDALAGGVLRVREASADLWDDAGGVRFEAMGDKADVKTIDVTPPLVAALGRYQMLTEGPSPKVKTQVYGRRINTDLFTDELGHWDATSAAKGAAVDAHYNAMHALRYFKEKHGRSGTTGRGNDITVVMHDPFDKGLNAYHEASLLGLRSEMHCGDGDYLTGGNVLPFCSAYDVVVHELAHGVTDHTSALVYEGESGALNESFSDVMGEAAENALEVNDAVRNILVGERAYKDGKGAVRDMLNPARFGQPIEYTQRKVCAPGEVPSHVTNDNCGVHGNSGIPNRAFTLMTLGGRHQTTNIGVPKGLGWAASRELWYRTFTKLRPQATFSEAALMQVSEATLMGPDALQAVGCAWHAVGVLVLGGVIHPAFAQMTCPAPADFPAAPAQKGPSCQGRTDGWVCSDKEPDTALKCRNGLVDDGAFCEDARKACKKAAADDWTATVGADGKLVCE